MFALFLFGLIFVINLRPKQKRSTDGSNIPSKQERPVIETSREWRHIVSDSEIVILDTETSGLPPNAEVVEVAVINANGDILLHELNLPKGSISRKATDIHGLTKARIRDRGFRPWAETHDRLIRILSDASRVVTYNALFDKEVLEYTSSLHGKALPNLPWYDAMSTYVGEGYSYVTLTVAATWEGVEVKNAHSAVGDARMTLALIKAVTARQTNNLPIPPYLKYHRSVQHLGNRSNSSSRSNLGATEKQIDFIYDLLYERHVPTKKKNEIMNNIDLMTRQEASQTIDYLLNRPI